MNEFDAIENFFLPLCFENESALSLKDDVAFLKAENLIISSDTLVENTHFRQEDDAFSIGQKLVCVNVSDIIAKGAYPYCGILNISWNKARGIEGLKELSLGIKKALIENAGNMPIIGGDTTKINGPIVLSLTIFAKPFEKIIKRHNAKNGEIICVTGNIGDAKIGLEALQNGANYKNAISHYQIPKIPKLETAKIIAKYANSSLDISDGLLGDLKKLLNDNNYEIEFAKIPFSDDAFEWLKNNSFRIENIFELLSFGDDYQCAFTIDEENIEKVKIEFADIKQKISFIGNINNENASFINLNGKKIEIDSQKLSYVHNFDN